MIVTVLVFVTFSRFISPVANAATVDCFCYLAGTGAEKDTTVKTASACQEACKKKTGYEGYLPATDPSQFPMSNLRCFTKPENCEKNLDGDAENTIDGEWGETQPGECLSGSHYCYATATIKTTLQIDILGTKSVIDFAEYVDLVYRLLLGFALVVTIVLMMIGGIRYVIGATSGDVTKAKDMIKKSIEGFVLLIFAYVILFTVNPQLIKLQVPKLPMLRGIDFTQGDDCVVLFGGDRTDSASYFTNTLTEPADKSTYPGARATNSSTGWTSAAVIKYTGSPECGTTAEVLLNAEGNAVTTGTTCNFNYCTDGKLCTNGLKKNTCVTCKEIGPENTYGVSPSASVCQSLDPQDTLIGDGPEIGLYNVCGYTQDPYMFFREASGSGSTATLIFRVADAEYSAYTAGSCVSMNIDCTNMNACEEYDSVTVENYLKTTTLQNLSSDGTPNIIDICNDDPCDAGFRQTTPPEVPLTCKYIESVGCRSNDYTP